jgi:hypothetical protein
MITLMFILKKVKQAFEKPNEVAGTEIEQGAN